MSTKEERDAIRNASKEAIKNGRLLDKDLPMNANYSQKFKYHIFQRILWLVVSNAVTKEELSHKLKLPDDRLEKLLHCYIDEFTLDEVFSYIENLKDFLNNDEFILSQKSLARKPKT